MKSLSGKPQRERQSKLAYQGGSYSLAMIAIVIAILVAVNILAGVMPDSLTRFDTSSSKLYSITSNTKTVVNNLEDDVTIYWITQAGEEDDVLENLLGKYEALSDHISVVRKNPDIYPTFAEQYTEEQVKNNSLVVECGDRSRYIGLDDIYLAQPDMANYTVDASFDGEGAITSAIDYVVNAEQPVVYALEGHGEAALPPAFQDQLTKANMELKQFSLLNEDGVPVEAACVLIHAPSSDLSPEEADMLREYTRTGGKLLVMAGPLKDDSLPNLYSLLEDYGVKAEEGIVVEQDRAHYAFRVPYVLMPLVGTHAVTESLVEEHYYPVAPISRGLRLTETPVDGVVTELLTTSEQAFSKVEGYDLTTYDKEKGDLDGPFAIGVAIDCSQDGQIIWYSTSLLLDEMYNAYSSGANLDLAMNSLASLVGESEAMAIRSKSLNYNYLTISESTSTLLKVLMIGVFPVTFLGIGTAVVLKRRRRYSEAVS